MNEWSRAFIKRNKLPAAEIKSEKPKSRWTNDKSVQTLAWNWNSETDFRKIERCNNN